MRKLIDKILWKLGYVSKSKIKGTSWIIPEGKFELIKVQNQRLITRNELIDMTPESGAFYLNHVKRDMLTEIEDKILPLGEWQQQLSGWDEAGYTLKYIIHIAKRKE
jgi:hypothetical protein